MSFWDLFKRGKKVVEAKANKGMDVVESKNIVPLAKQALLDMKKELNDSKESYTTVKALHIKSMAAVAETKSKISAKLAQKTALKAKYNKLMMSKNQEGTSTEDIALILVALEELVVSTQDVIGQIEVLEGILVRRELTESQNSERAEKLKARVEAAQEKIENSEDRLVEVQAQTEMAEAELLISKNSNSSDSGSGEALFIRMEVEAANKEAKARAYDDLAGASKDTRIENILDAEIPGQRNSAAEDFLSSNMDSDSDQNSCN